MTQLNKSKCCDILPASDFDLDRNFILYCPNNKPGCMSAGGKNLDSVMKLWNDTNNKNNPEEILKVIEPQLKEWRRNRKTSNPTIEREEDDMFLSNDPVNHPKHYTQHPSGVECIQITRHMKFNLGNAFKYIWRADLKNDTIEDLEKAIWYIKDEIALRKGEK